MTSADIVTPLSQLTASTKADSHVGMDIFVFS